MRLKNIFFIVIVVTAFISGCATSKSTIAAKGTGTERSYPVPFNKAWAEMPDVISLVGLTYVRGDIGERYMLAERGAGGWTWGEKVAIFITPEGQLTRVEVVAKPVLATNVTSAYWTWPDAIFIELDRRWKR